MCNLAKILHWQNSQYIISSLRVSFCQDVLNRFPGKLVLFLLLKSFIFSNNTGNSLAVQWLGLSTFTAEGPDSIPGWGTKILQAAWRGHTHTKKPNIIGSYSYIHMYVPYSHLLVMHNWQHFNILFFWIKDDFQLWFRGTLILLGAGGRVRALEVTWDQARDLCLPLGTTSTLFKKFLFIYIYFWLCWVFVSVWGLSLVAASGGHSSSRCAGLSLSRPLLLRSTGSRRTGSAVVAHGPSCSAACGIFPDQGSNPCPLHWQVDSQPLRHQGSPKCYHFWVVFCLVLMSAKEEKYAAKWTLTRFVNGGLAHQPLLCNVFYLCKGLASSPAFSCLAWLAIDIYWYVSQIQNVMQLHQRGPLKCSARKMWKCIVQLTKIHLTDINSLPTAVFLRLAACIINVCFNADS